MINKTDVTIIFLDSEPIELSIAELNDGIPSQILKQMKDDYYELMAQVFNMSDYIGL